MIKVITGESLRELIEIANNMSIKKEEIISLNAIRDYYVLVYFRN